MEGNDVTQAPMKTDGEVGRITEDDQRRFRRTRTNCLVEMSLPQDHRRRRCEGRLTELSPGGGLLELDDACPVGSRLTLRFWLPDLSDVVCTGIVRCQREGQGVGIEFVNRSPQDLARLKASLRIRRSLEQVAEEGRESLGRLSQPWTSPRRTGPGRRHSLITAGALAPPAR